MRKIRRITYNGDLAIPSDGDSTLIVDSGCDQSIITLNHFIVTVNTGVYYTVHGALQGRMSSGNTMLEVVNGYTLATLRDGRKYIIVVNQALLDRDPRQTESLLQPHQCRAYGTAVDECSILHTDVHGEKGTQQIKAVDCSIPLLFDGFKTFLSISKPSKEDFEILPHLVLTSSTAYDPTLQKRCHTRRVFKAVDVTFEEWRARLGYPTLAVTKKTIAATTQMVKTLEAETREYMRDHFKSRVRCLRPKRLNDTLYSDTFFSSVKSVRGFTKFQLFTFKKCKRTICTLMKRESQAPDAYLDIIRNIGAPNRTVTDNAKVCTGTRWTNINREYCIESGLTIPHHQNQNIAEFEGGCTKLRTIKMFHETPWAPPSYWCYAVDYINETNGFLARGSIGWKIPNEILLGETGDISVFRFKWFSPVWYYAPEVSYPADKMLPGFVLGIAPTVGDGFSYIILPKKDYKDIPHYRNPTTIVRSVVRSRDIQDNLESAPVCTIDAEGFKFTNALGEELLGEEELTLLPDEVAEENVDGGNEVATVHIPDDGNVDHVLFQNEEDWALNGGDNILPLPHPVPAVDTVEEPVVAEEEAPSNVIAASTATPISNLTPLSTPTPLTVPADEESSSETEAHFPIITQSMSEGSEPEDRPSSSVVREVQDTPVNPDEVIQMVNDSFLKETGEEQDDDLYSINNHRTTNGVLEFEIEYTSGDTDWLYFNLVQSEDPHACADYVMNNDLGKIFNSKYRRWARKFLRSVRRTMRRMFRVRYDGFNSRYFTPKPTAPIIHCRRVAHSKKEKKRRNVKKAANTNKQMGTFKYGLPVPKKWSDVIRLDKAAGDSKWQDAIAKEVASLLHHQCFDFKSPDFKPSSDYQYAPLNLVYDVKPDLRYKARLVINGMHVDPRGLSTRATVVKGVSVRLLDIIADHQDLEVITGDIGNAFIQAHTKEKVYTRCGPEFGPRSGAIAILIRALYGLTTSANRYRTLFADFLREMGFVPTRYDRDVWMRLRESNDGYDYICTHVDDFKIVGKDPSKWMRRIEQTFLVKESGPRDYYLGNNYKYHDGLNVWTYGCDTYTAEALRRVEAEFGILAKEKTAMPTKDEQTHPETDTSPLLGLDDHRKYQMLLGMLQWMVTIGRPDLCHAITSLNRFGSCPREFHLELAIRVFGYLKTFPTRQIAIDSRPLELGERDDPSRKIFTPGFLEDYPDAREELDSGFPRPFGETLQTAICVDSDHAHDLKTRRSITGLIAFVGSTPVVWYSKRQGSIASSTYSAEFSALRTATEEAQALRYMLRCLGIPIANDGSNPTLLFGDNFSVIQNARDFEADLKKKHVAISFHTVREAVAAGVVEPVWLKGKWNISDIMTKQISGTEANGHNDTIFFRPDFHIRTCNNLKA